jgi:hypothetical protein
MLPQQTHGVACILQNRFHQSSPARTVPTILNDAEIHSLVSLTGTHAEARFSRTTVAPE